MTIDELIKKIKEESKTRSTVKNEHLEGIEEGTFSVPEMQNMEETVLFRYAKKIGKYLQKKGLRGFVNFVRRNINVQQYSIRYKIEDFTKYNDEAFIDNAYELILNREADVEGKKNHLERLREGKVSKLEIIIALHFSEEGKAQDITLDSAKRLYLLTQSYKVPFFGYCIKSFSAMVTLPKILQQVRKNENNIALQYKQLNETLQAQNLDNKLRFQELDEYLQKHEIEIQKLIDTQIAKEKIDISIQSLTEIKKHITKLVEKAKKRLPEQKFTQNELESIANEENHLLDDLYLSFENRFRGTRAEIKNKVEVYLPYLDNLEFAKNELSILDVGCGRGEWLELLNENGYKKTTGIDLNRIMVTVAQEKNLNVKESDVIKHLKSLDDESLSVITGFHIIEHLPFETLMTLFTQSLRVLKKGGMILFETPNPRNILVGSSDFYLDPTHINPIHPLTLKFLVEEVGFLRVDSLILNEDKLTNFDDLNFGDINDYINIGRDLSVIAYK